MMERIIIYGAGKKGQQTFQFLDSINASHLIEAFCDKNAESIRVCGNVPVIDIHEAKSRKLPFLIGVGNQYINEVKKILASEKIYQSVEDFCREELSMSRVEYSRAYCAYYHVDNMDDYFKIAETDKAMEFFWGEGICKELFMKLDHKNIIELACGRGRHVPKYIELAEKITLVDILEKNIKICRNRFQQYNNISYYTNSGKDLADLPSDTYTSIFTYDSMVHFELMDIAAYLNECNRVLVKGGMALFHHSNNHSDYKVIFANATHGRNYMSKDLFAYLANRAGLEILQQEVVDWGGVKDLDCITLVRKQ